MEFNPWMEEDIDDTSSLLSPDLDGAAVVEINFPTPRNNWTEQDVFDACTHTLVNSTLALECGSYYDRDIMLPMDICLLGLFD